MRNRAATGGGKEGRETERQTGGWRSSVIYCVSYFSVISVVEGDWVTFVHCHVTLLTGKQKIGCCL